MSDGVRNAKIVSSFLGNEDHGILTAVLGTESGASHQGFGTYDLRSPGVLAVWVQKILWVTGARNYDSKDLVGKYVRVRSEGGLLQAIGHITEERWFTPKTDLPWEGDK